MGISLPASGRMTILPTMSLYLSSSGLTAMATSENMVSGLEVATVMPSLPSAPGYLKYQYLPFLSTCSTSISDRALPQTGHQLIRRLPL